MNTLPVHPACPSNSAAGALHFHNKWFLPVAISFLLFQSARATLYMSEPFDYPAGPLTNAIPWSTNGTAVEAGTATLQLVSGDLAYSPLTDPAPVNHVRMQFSTNIKACRQISGTPLGDPSAGGSVYVSFMLYKANTNSGTGSAPIIGINTTAANTINQTAADGMVLYYQPSGVAGSGTYHLGIRIGGGAVAATYPSGTQVYISGNTSTGDVGQTNLVVMKYTFVNGSANDTVALWVNPDPGSFGGSEPAATTNDLAAVNFGAADAAAGLKFFQTRGGSGTSASGIIQLDNLLVGDTWADVTPTCVTAGTSIPANQSVSPGQTATFSIIPTGSGPTFQWQTNNGVSGWVNVGGATGSSYTTPAQTLANNGLQFRCTVSVSCNSSSVTSAVATLTVQTCVTAGISSNPSDQSINANHTATFSVTTSGTSPAFQWQTNNVNITTVSNWVNIGGATSSSYTTPSEPAANSGLLFRCHVSVACNGSSTNSAAANLTVTCAPASVTNPQNQTTVAGQTATFSVVGSGSDPAYQWATNNGSGWVNIIGATNASYTTKPEIVDDYGLQFQCTVNVACDSSSAVSAAANLLVICNTAGTTDPANQAVGAGQTAVFSITGSGSNPTYQWQTNNGGGWVNIGGATSASYTSPAQTVANNNLQFRCNVTTPCDGATATSAAATLNVYPGTAKFRSITSGNINDPNTWEESFDGGATWTTPALYAPADVNSTNILVQSGHTVVNSANSQLDQLVVQAGGQISISTNTTLTIANGAGTDLDISGTVDATGKLTINSNATAFVESGGVLINEQGGSETVTGTLTFNSGGAYQHNYASAAGTIPTAIWNTGSSCQIIGYTSNNGTLAGATQAFYDFIWNCPGQNNQVPLGGSIPTTVYGDMTFISTGTGEVRFSNNNNPTSNIAGNLNLQGGRLILSSGNGKVVLNVSNNVNITGGILSNNPSATGFGTINFAKAGTQIFTNGGTIGGPINWVVNSGSTLNGGSSVLASNLTLAGGGQIRLSTSPPLFTVSGNLNNNNNTVVVDLGGATVGPGSYPLLNYGGSRQGSPNPTPSIVNGTISTGTAVIDASTPNQIRLTVVNPRTPAITGLGLSGTTLTLSGTNGTLNGSYGVLVSTNLVLPIQQWTPIIVNGLFDGSGNFNTNIQLTLNTNAPQQFFIMKSPTP